MAIREAPPTPLPQPSGVKPITVPSGIPLGPLKDAFAGLLRRHHHDEDNAGTTAASGG